MKQKIELKSCPFCGGEATTSENAGVETKHPEWGWVGCQECHLFVKYVGERGLMLATDKWNHRANPVHRALQLDEVANMVGQPVWIRKFNEYGERCDPHWRILGKQTIFHQQFKCCPEERLEDYGKLWLLYNRSSSY